jgi:hypothetical protein
LYIANHCTDVAANTLHTALHEPRIGLTGNITSTLRPQWTRHDVRFEGDGNGYLTVIEPTLRFAEPEPRSTLPLIRGFVMRSTPSRLTIYSAGHRSTEDARLLTILERDSLCKRVSMDGEETVCPEIVDAFVYLDQNEARVDGDLYREISPMAHRVPAGEPITFAAGPYWAWITLYLDPLAVRAFASWHGPLNERRFFEAMPPVVTVRNEAGVSLGTFTKYGDVLLPPPPLSPGGYRIDAVQSRSYVAGLPATFTASAFFDTRRADSAHPQLTGWRVVDGEERQTSVLVPDQAASLLFSVTDILREGTRERRVPIREEATRVDYRTRGTTEWRSLTPIVTARQYLESEQLPEGVGTVYRVDLSTLTHTVLGAVDLRIHAEDDAGNATEMLLEPALAVRSESGRRRSVRH